MGLLNRTRKPPKTICPQCGKPNEPAPDGGLRRCKICRSILPATNAVAPSGNGGVDLGGAGPTATGGAGAPEVAHESFDMDGLSMTTFARAPQGRAALDQAPLEPEGFDPGALEFGEPALPRPSSND
jgi:hypothetical protein